jgi:hypothetical protein
VKVTFTDCGLLLTPSAVTGTLAVYVPAPRLPVAAVSVNVLGAAVALRAAVNHPVGWPEA